MNDEALKSSLASQYRAALRMLREAIDRCPDEVWYDDSPCNAFWQVAYHTLFFAHLYMQVDEAAFVPFRGHQARVQHPDGFRGPADPGSPLPLLPDPYSRGHVLDYCDFCIEQVEGALGEMDLGATGCGFYWYPIGKFEHQLVNIRHIQHGAAQLADRLRAACDHGVKWHGRG